MFFRVSKSFAKFPVNTPLFLLEDDFAGLEEGFLLELEEFPLFLFAWPTVFWSHSSGVITPSFMFNGKGIPPYAVAYAARFGFMAAHAFLICST